MYSLLEQKKSKEAATKATKKQNTGIPTHLQEKFETKYGMSLDDVHVYYNSTKPAKLGALAYTQGTSVHIGPGNDKYLQHELGHVIQQKFLRISPTKIINGYPVNDDPLLEKAADQPEGIHTDFHREADSEGNVLQLATAYVSYIIDDALLKSGKNHSVGLGGEGGVSHAEQFAWGEKRSDIMTQLENGKKVDIIFHVDTQICNGCKNWFETTVYNELLGTGGKFSLKAEVGNHQIEILGTNTIWPNEIAFTPTWERLGEFDRLAKFIDENRNEDGTLGANMNSGAAYILQTFQNMMELNNNFKNELIAQFNAAKINAVNRLYPDTDTDTKNTILDKITLYQTIQQMAVSMAKDELNNILQQSYCGEITSSRNLMIALYNCFYDFFITFLETTSF